MKIRNCLHIFLMALLVLTTGSSIHGQYLDLLWERFAHYPFSGDARDISGFNNHGLVNGAVLSEDHMGEGESAYFFDGLDDYINCGSNLEILSSSVTVSCWIKTGAEMDNSHIVSKYDFSSDAGFILGTQEGLAKWAGRNGTGQFIRITSGTRIDDNQWHCLVGIVDGDTWSLYVDGVLENQVESGSESVGLSTAVPMTIGNNFLGDDGDHRHFEGSVDNVIIYGRALNECELHILSTGEPYEAR